MELQPTDLVHFIGIGGVSMSALAHALADRGYRVSGSDRGDGPVLADLRAAGITTFVGHAAEHVTTADVVIYTTAIRDDNPELAAARAAGKRVYHRADMLAWMLGGPQAGRGKQGLAVTGTHGKTTCSAMLGVVLTDAGLDPTAFVGGLVNNWGANYRLGAGPHIVFEACESDASFLKYHGCSQIITGIEDDHLDRHKSSEALDEAFGQFLESADPEGFVVWHADCERLARLIHRTAARLISYGFGEGHDYSAADVEMDGAQTRFRVVRSAHVMGTYERLPAASGLAAGSRSYDPDGQSIELQVPGRHNVLNSLATIAAAEAVGMPFGAIAAALAGFRGTGRRFELLGRCNGLSIYDDYAHHPTEVRATLEAARNFSGKRLVAIFQPHLYSRTLNLLDEFAAAFDEADVVIINDIYAAREEPVPGVDGGLLAAEIRRHDAGKPVEYLPAQEDIVERVAQLAQSGDLILTIGAGDIRRVGEQLARRLCQTDA